MADGARLFSALSLYPTGKIDEFKLSEGEFGCRKNFPTVRVILEGNRRLHWRISNRCWIAEQGSLSYASTGIGL